MDNLVAGFEAGIGFDDDGQPRIVPSFSEQVYCLEYFKLLQYVQSISSES